MTYLSLILVLCLFIATIQGTTTSETFSDFSGDGSGDSSEPLNEGSISPPTLLDFSKESEESQEERILWRDALGDIRQSKLGQSNVESITRYMNTDGLPEQFRRLTSEYLNGMIVLINNRLGATTPQRPLFYECTQSLPERFYGINFRAFDALRHCPNNCLLADIGVNYVNAVNDLVLDLFKCLDNDRSSIRQEDHFDQAISTTASA